MSRIQEIDQLIQQGRGKKVCETIQAAMDEGISAADILREGMLPAMSAIGEKFKNNEEFAGITLNDMLVHAVAKVILDFPMLNAHLNGDTLRVFEKANIGVAVDTPRGLLVPAVIGASDMSLLKLSKELKSLIAITKDGKLPADNARQATFTVSNLGSFGIESFTPVINPPQTGILGVDTISYKLRKDGSTYPAMGLSLTLDHGAMDGADGAKFLKALVAYLENFDMMQMK